MKILVSMLLLVVSTGALRAQNGLHLVGHLDQKHGIASGYNYNGSWGYVAPDGREYAILGTATGTAIIDITDTSDIHEIVHIPGPTSIWREMRTYKDRLYVVTENGGGTQIIDLSQLPTTATLVQSFIYSNGRNTANSHTIEIFDGYMYLNGCSNWGALGQRGAVIFSLANPDNPQFVGEYSPNYFHDSYVRNDTIFGASIYSSGGIYIADIKNKSVPIPIGKISYPGSGTHNVWTTMNGKYVISADEIGATQKSLKFWDVGSLPAIPVTPDASYLFSGLGDIEHNVVVRGNYAYTAWYTAGTVVADVTDPLAPFTAGWYDSSNDILYPPGSYNGVWAVYPFFWSGKITAGDMQNGLYVFMFDSLAARTPSSLLGPANGTTFCDESPVTFRWTSVADPVRDPLSYQLHIVGPGIDTLVVAGIDTSIILDPVFLGFGAFQWSVITKDEANAIATQNTFGFTRPARIPVVASPNGGEALKTESEFSVTWSSGCTDSVELSYSTNNGATWIIVESSLPALPALYQWTVPITPTLHGRFRVRSVPDTSRADQSNAQFSLFNSHSVSLLSPAGGDVWKAGTVRNISWTSGFVTHVRIEYSSNNGALWQTVVSDTPFTAAPVAWTVPGGATTQARVRVTDIDNISVYGENGDPFTIWPMTMTLSASWNLVSFPGTPSDAAPSPNFPGAVSAVHGYQNGYQQEDSIRSGAGYWVRYDSAQTIPLNGTEVPGDSIAVSEKWNIIGPLSIPIPASSLSPLPNTMTLSAPYGYEPDSGYTAADTLRPGKGYWIKTSESGHIILSAPPLRFVPAASAEGGDLITFVDAKGRRRSLAIGVPSSDAELPPPPPVGAFDVRFASQARAEEIGSAGSVIEVRSAAYPLSVSLDRRSSRVYRLVEKKGSAIRARYSFAGDRVVIPTAAGGTLVLESADEYTRPKEFELSQNWPNPFNPVTTISYDLFERGHISLTIYTLLGSMVASLVDETQDAGRHSVEFSAGDLPTGVYLCRLRTEGGTEMRKMVLAK